MKKIIIIGLMLFNIYSIYGQNIGLQAGLSVTDLNTYKSGYEFNLYSEFKAFNNFYIMPDIGINTLAYNNSETESYNGASVLKNESRTTYWYQISVNGLYKFLELGNFNSKAGPRLGYLYFPAHKGIFSGNTLVDGESRFSYGFLLNFQLRSLFGSSFGLDFNTNISYINKSKMNNIDPAFNLVRPWSQYLISQFEIGIFYEFKK